MREFIGIVLAVADERRHVLAIMVTILILIAAVWAMLLAGSR